MPSQPYPSTLPTAQTSIRIIGIAGGSGSGKTYLAQSVARELGATVISVDAYYRDLSYMTPAERARQNVDHPDSIDFELFRSQMQQLAAGESIQMPVYDFRSHTRSSETIHVEGKGIVVVEGIFALYDALLCEELTLTVFVELESAPRLERRMERDIRERGRTPECVTRQYRETVQPMYESYIEPTQSRADLVLRGDEDIEKNVAAVVEALRRREHRDVSRSA